MVVYLAAMKTSDGKTGSSLGETDAAVQVVVCQLACQTKQSSLPSQTEMSEREHNGWMKE